MTRTSTLVGVATGTPDGGVAIVRLSGSSARVVAEGLVGALGPPRMLVRRAVSVAGSREDALVVWMPGPASFTGEDVVELHVHAGVRNVRAVVEACVALGARAAGPGEFTRRAFEHGRLSLDQAEGIAAVIGARTDAALAQARRLVAGDLGQAVEGLREAIAELRTEIEANLDFPEDVHEGEGARWAAEIAAVTRRVEVWLGGFEAGRRARERARIVLAGPVNAGKSSLFNALLGRARAIVAEVPGTTRDYVEAELELGPYGVTLVDTAGLRETSDRIEAEGVARSRVQVEQADVVLWIEAADAEPVHRPELGGTLVLVESKRDVGTRRPQWLGVSVTGDPAGLDHLRARIEAWFEASGDAPWIGLSRHRGCAEEAREHLDAAAAVLAQDGPLEGLAFELAAAESRLGEITGRTALGPVGEAMLDRIFSRFCIGK